LLDRSNPIGSLGELRPRDESLMSAEFLPPGPRAVFAPAHIVEYTPNRVVVETDLTAVGYLILSDAWYPGWTAMDNGKRTSVIPANVLFRAVPLSSGKHHVEFQYRPPGFRVAAFMSLIAWLTVVGLLVSRLARRGIRPIPVARNNGAGIPPAIVRP
jgi:Bacterial membrane protein YfhO